MTVCFTTKCIYILYVDNSIICSPTRDDIKQALCVLQQTKLKFTIEGDMGDFLGINISSNSNDMVSLTQSHLISVVLKDF